MTHMHFFCNVWWRKVDNNFLFFHLRIVHIIYEFIYSVFDEFVFELNLKKSFLVSNNGTQNIILKEILFNFLGKLNNRFCAKSMSFFFVAMNIKLFHSWWGDVITFIFGTILKQYIWFDPKSFIDDSSHYFPDKNIDKLALCFHTYI